MDDSSSKAAVAREDEVSDRIVNIPSDNVKAYSELKHAEKTEEFVEEINDNIGNSNDIVQECLFNIPVQTRFYSLNQNTKFVPIWCANIPMPNLEEMVQLAQFHVTDDVTPQVILNTEHPQTSTALSDFIKRLIEKNALDGINDSPTMLVACKTLTKEISHIAQEIAIINALTKEERRCIEISLKILEEKKSRWITGLFKYAAAVSSEELAKETDGIERSFEFQGNAPSEVWKDKETKKKKYKSVSKLLPDFFKHWLHVFSERRKTLKAN